MPLDPIPQLETLDDAGFTFEQVGEQVRRRSANYGDGYTAGARFSVLTLKAFRVRIDVLPDFIIGGCVETYQDSRARYLRGFWRRHQAGKDSPIFICRDPFPDDPERNLNRIYCRFANENETEINFTLDTEYLMSTGLILKQARISGYPLDANDYNPAMI